MDLRSRDNSYTKLDITEDHQDRQNYSRPLAPLPAEVISTKALIRNLYQYVIQNWSSLMPLFIFAAINMTLLLLVFVFHDAIFSKLNDLGLYLRSLGVTGMVIPIFIIVLASFPPIPGYGTMSVLCGFVYGFPLGFLPPFIGGVIGASACFFASRKYGRRYIRKLLTKFTYIEAALKAIEIKGAKLLFLIRVAPYPWTIMNFVMGATRLSYTEYISATAFSLPKLFLHIYIGSSIQNFTEKRGLTTSNLLFAGITIALGIGATAYLYFLCKAVINETLEETSKNSDYGDDIPIDLGFDM